MPAPRFESGSRVSCKNCAMVALVADSRKGYVARFGTNRRLDESDMPDVTEMQSHAMRQKCELACCQFYDWVVRLLHVGSTGCIDGIELFQS